MRPPHATILWLLATASLSVSDHTVSVSDHSSAEPPSSGAAPAAAPPPPAAAVPAAVVAEAVPSQRVEQAAEQAARGEAPLRWPGRR